MMDELLEAPATQAGEDVHCPACDAPLHGDQRYCLNCGRRRGAMRLPFAEIVAPHATAAGGAAAAPASPERSPLVALGALIALLLALAIGVLLGRGSGDGEPAVRAPVITVAAPAAPAAAAQTPFVSDWSSGAQGYVVSLTTLPATASAAEVAQAKQDATGKGAGAVGAMRGDEHPSLPAGRIVVYAGPHATRAAAKDALKGLRAQFPGAKVVHITSGAPGDEPAAAGSSGGGRPRAQDAAPATSGYGEATKKPPPTVQTPGPAPPLDDAPPGGGSGEATEIG